MCIQYGATAAGEEKKGTRHRGVPNLHPKEQPKKGKEPTARGTLPRLEVLLEVWYTKIYVPASTLKCSTGNQYLSPPVPCRSPLLVARCDWPILTECRATPPSSPPIRSHSRLCLCSCPPVVVVPSYSPPSCASRSERGERDKSFLSFRLLTSLFAFCRCILHLLTSVAFSPFC